MATFNPLKPLLALLRQRRDAKFAHDQAQAAQQLGGCDATFPTRRAQLQALFAQRQVHLPEATLSALREDPVVARTGALLRSAVAALGQDPAVKALAEHGVRMRYPFTVLEAPTFSSAFIEQIQVLTVGQRLEFRDLLEGLGSTGLASALPGPALRDAAQVVLLHDLLPEAQRTDFLNAVLSANITLERTEASLPQRPKSPIGPR